MEKVTIVVERASDGTFSAYSELVSAWGMGDTAEEAKKGAAEGLRQYIENNVEIPEVLQEEYEIEYRMDVQSMMEYYKGIFTKAAFERLTGINQKQIQHYATGHRKPKAVTLKKMEEALHKLGNELLTVRL